MIDPSLSYQLLAFVDHEMNQSLPPALMDAMKLGMLEGLQAGHDAKTITANIERKAASAGITLKPEHTAVIARNVEKILPRAGT